MLRARGRMFGGRSSGRMLHRCLLRSGTADFNQIEVGRPLRDTAQQVVKQIFLAYGITAILDDSVPTTSVRVDLTNARFAEASTAVQLSTDTFLVPLDTEHVLVAKDTKENRAKFQRLLLETVFLPGLNPKQMSEPLNMIKTVFGVKQASVHAATGALSIRAPESTLRANHDDLARITLRQRVATGMDACSQRGAEAGGGVRGPGHGGVVGARGEGHKLTTRARRNRSVIKCRAMVNMNDFGAVGRIFLAAS